MIEFFGKMRYYPFDLQDNRIFLKTSELLGARSLLLVKNIERHLIENDTASKDQKKISANGNEPTKQNSKSAFSPFKKKSQAFGSKFPTFSERSRGPGHPCRIVRLKQGQAASFSEPWPRQLPHPSLV